MTSSRGREPATSCLGPESGERAWAHFSSGYKERFVCSLLVGSNNSHHRHDCRKPLTRRAFSQFREKSCQWRVFVQWPGRKTLTAVTEFLENCSAYSLTRYRPVLRALCARLGFNVFEANADLKRERFTDPTAWPPSPSQAGTPLHVHHHPLASPRSAYPRLRGKWRQTFGFEPPFWFSPGHEAFACQYFSVQHSISNVNVD